MPRRKMTSQGAWIVTMASIAVVISALYLAQSVLIPLTLAVLLSFLLSPICNWLERRGLGRIPAVLVTVFVGFSVLGAVAWTAAAQMTTLGAEIPQYKESIAEKVSSVNSYAASSLRYLARLDADVEEELDDPAEQSVSSLGTRDRPYSVRVVDAPVSPWAVFGGVFGTVVEVLGTAGIVFVFVVFFLIRREDLRDRFIHVVGRGNVTLTTQMMEDAAKRVSRYLSMLFLINVSFGISVSVGLFLIGMPKVILWGILATVLRFVPYIGPWIAAVMPIGLSLAISPDWVMPALVVLLFIVLELISNNILEPWLYGKNTGVSAVAVLLAAVFWMWLWGPVGLLLATPLTVCLLVVGKHVPQLSFLRILLGNEPVFDRQTRIYQRLLAGDQEEATELLDEYLESESMTEVYDTVVMPALVMTEMHWQRDELDERHHDFILRGLMEIIQDSVERRGAGISGVEESAAAQVVENDAMPADGEHPNAARFRVLCVPARTQADVIAAHLLAQVVDARQCDVRVVSLDSSTAETDRMVEEFVPDLLCISATPPAASMHARHRSHHIRARFPKIPLVVGLWNSKSDLSKAQQRIGKVAGLFTTLADAQKYIQSEIKQREAQRDASGPELAISSG